MGKIRGKRACLAPTLGFLEKWLTPSGYQFPTCHISSLALFPSYTRDKMPNEKCYIEGKLSKLQ